jgi:hypothetical protein
VTAVLDLVDYLIDHGLQVHRAAGNEVTVHCWWCPDGDPKGKGRLYLNSDSWLYDCKRCGERGNRRTLLHHFGDEDELTYAPGADPMLRRRILGEAADLAHEMLLGNQEKIDYLLGRGLSPEIIVDARLGYVPQNIGLADNLPGRSQFTYRDLITAGLITISGRDFFNDCLIIPYFSHGTVVQLRCKDLSGDSAGRYRTTSGDYVRLYNADSLFGADQVLVTEGEFDSLAVRTQITDSDDRELSALAVVGLPGAGSFPDGLVATLGQASRVFVGLDPDEVGIRFSQKLCDQLGANARHVALPTGEPKTDWTAWFQPRTTRNLHGGHGWRDLRDLLVDSDLAGKQMFSVADAAAKWRKRQIEAPGLKTGFPTLDAVLRPGVKPGQVLLPLAKSGTGKTVFLSNLAHNCRSQRTLYVSLEMTAAEVFEHLRRIHHFWNPTATYEQMMLDYQWLQIVERNRIGRGDLGDLVAEYTRTIGTRPQLLILDYLQYYARGFRGDGMYEKVSDAAMELKAVAKEEDLVAVCPSQVNRVAKQGMPISADDARDSGVVDETGDFVISLYRPDQLVTDANGVPPLQTGAFHLGLLKSRHGGKGRVFQLRMSLMSLVIADVLADKAAVTRIDQENRLVAQGIHYDDFRKSRNNEVAQRTLEIVK